MKPNHREIKYLDLKAINAPFMEEIEEEMAQVLDRGWYLQGEAVSQFEKIYAETIGTKYCISCGNGLDALKLTLMGEIAIGNLHLGDEIIVPANTYIATIIAITSVGLTPRLVDAHSRTYQLDASLLESNITEKTKAVMLVHLYGRNAYTQELQRIIKKHKLLLFEDNAQAFGCICKNSKEEKMTGCLGEAAAHSFYPSKNLGALGDAGAVTTNNEELADAIRALHNYGKASKDEFGYIGINSRMDELQACVLNVKLRHKYTEGKKRYEQVLRYREEIDVEVMNEKNLFFQDCESSEYVAHVVPLLTSHRDELREYLAVQGIQTQVHYPIPPHKQRCYQNWNSLSFPVTETIASEELSLPCNSSLTEEEQERIILAINQFFYKN